MASKAWSKRYDALSGTMRFLERRTKFPGCRQTDLMLRQRVAGTEDLFWRDLKGHFGCVNAIEFSHGPGEIIASGGDDRRVLLWNVEKALSDIGSPDCMKGEHNSNIFCLAIDVDNTTVFSGGNDEQVIVHDMESGATKDVFSHEDAVYGLSVDPNNPHVFASACDDGRVLIFDIRESTADAFCLANYTSPMHAVMYNPMEPRLLATANAKEGIGLWDVRRPRSCILRYGGSHVQQSCMSVRFNYRGDQLIALRRRLPPVLYELHSHLPICEFDHTGYYNSCTMKSITYAGDRDQYVLSGSDEFNLYMWAIPEDLSERQYIDSAHMVLKGHRSIVNQVRFNPSNHVIASSGVEKVIKVWSPFSLPSKKGCVTKESYTERPVYTHEEYINISIQGGPVMSHDYTQESTEEDQRMMAFFDSLVQRELESVSSDDDLSSNEEEMYSRIVQLSRSDLDSSDSADESNELNTSEEDVAFSPFTIAFASVMASQAADGNERFPRLHAISTNADNNATSSADTGASQVPTASNRRPAIADLVKKRKRELKEGIEGAGKKRNHAASQLSDSDSSEDEGDRVPALAQRDKSVAQRQAAQLKLKRLKTLRTMALKSDSESSDAEVKKCCPDSSAETVAATHKMLVGGECSSKARASPDLGPYLHEMTAPPGSSHSHGDGPGWVGGSDRVGKKPTDSHTDKEDVPSSKGEDSGEHSCGNSTRSSEARSSTDIEPKKSCGEELTCTGCEARPGCSQPASKSSDEETPNLTAVDPQPTWTEFKRYKHKLERARRHYRKQRNSDRNHSDDEDN